MRVNTHKRRRLAAQQSPAPDALRSAPTSQSDAETAHDANPDAATLAFAARMPPPPQLTMPPRTFAQVLAEHGPLAALGVQPPLTPPLGGIAPAMPTQAPPPPPPQVAVPMPAPSVDPAPLVSRAAPAASTEPLGALAQLRLQQGMTVDQWRSAALAGLDAAKDLTALREAITEAQAMLVNLPERPAWRLRRAKTLETIVQTATQRMTELSTQARDVIAMVPIYRALQMLAPEAFADERSAFLAAVGRIGESIFSRVGQDITTLEHAFTAFENTLPRMEVGFDLEPDAALRQALVSSLWYRLLEAPDALSTWSIQTWTGRSQSLCHMRPCPQIAALVWLRALLSMPSLNVEHCVRLTANLRDAWAVPQAPEQTLAGAQLAARPTHLPAEPAFEPAARTQLTTWVAVLTDQLPALAPFQADPVRQAFSQLAEALHIHIDIEIGLPATDGDADMQARELADFIREWEHDHGRPFPGYEALFNGEAGSDTDVDADVAASQVRRPQLSDFFPTDDFFGADDWTSAATRPQTPYSDRVHRPLHAHDVTAETDWLADSPPGLLSPPPNYTSQLTTPPGGHSDESSEAQTPSSSQYSSVPEVDSDWP